MQNLFYFCTLLSVSWPRIFFQSVDSAKRDNWEPTFKGTEKYVRSKMNFQTFTKQTYMGVNVFIFNCLYTVMPIICVLQGWPTRTLGEPNARRTNKCSVGIKTRKEKGIILLL